MNTSDLKRSDVLFHAVQHVPLPYRIRFVTHELDVENFRRFASDLPEMHYIAIHHVISNNVKRFEPRLESS
jgi:hypothetical protein